MSKRITLRITFLLGIFSLVTIGAFADDEEAPIPLTATHLASLKPDSRAPNIKGVLAYHKGDGAVDTTQFRFKGRIFLPNDEIGITNGPTAKANDLRVELRHAGATDPYSICYTTDKPLLKGKRGDTGNPRRAVYRIKTNQSSNGYKEPLGTCDSEPASKEIQAGMPDIQVDDTVSVFVHTVDFAILTGTVVPKN